MGNFGHESQGLKVIKVKTNELLEKVKDNRTKHVAEYQTALAGFRIDSEEKLKAELKAVKAGKLPPDHLYFEKPESHEKEYDTIIDMLSMTVDKELEITYEQFLRYARDEWPWTEKFKTLSTIYNARL